MYKPLSEFDFRIYSNDKTSHITFILEEYIHERLPSLACTIEVVDNKFIGWNINVWFELDKLLSFITELEDLEIKRQGSVTLNAMSPHEFNITIENYNKKGDLLVNYSLTNIKYNTDICLRNTLTGGFKIDSEFLLKLLSDFNKFSSVANLGVDIEFYKK